MANPDQLLMLTGSDGVNAWNRWREDNPGVIPDLSGADLSEGDLLKANLSAADLSGADLSGADLTEADLRMTDFSHANLSGANLARTTLARANLNAANLSWADLRQANLIGSRLIGANLHRANLHRANLHRANLHRANLARADLSGVDFRGARLVGADLRACLLLSCLLEYADLTGSRVYGASVWDARLTGATQKDLVITQNEQPTITVDNLEVAQFVYLLLNNAKIRDVIDTITSKAVLILGRFTPERKRTLDALRDALRARNYLPIVFDFEKPTNRDYTETVSTLAHLARFVIADLTDPRSIPQELTAIAPRLLSVPVRPLLLGSQKEWGMFNDLARYPQVIEPFHYTDDEMLLRCLESDVIEPAERKARELTGY